MRPLALSGLALALVVSAGAAGFWAGNRAVAIPRNPLSEVLAMLGAQSVSAEVEVRLATAQEATGPVIYYRDPEGRPAYSTVPRQTDEGRAFIAVRANEDVSIDAPAAMAAADALPAASAEGSATRRILYYRNPMGLPDTSPAPKKDSMGMDYIPVYEGTDDGDSIVRIAPGRLQQTGVRTEAAVRQAVLRPVVVPGTVELDERLVEVVATRADAFVEEIADVTTGDLVKAGQPLLRFYSPEITTAGAQYVTELKSDAGSRRLGGARQRLENLGVPAAAIAEIERTRKAPLTITWTAPRDGVVLERNAVDGMMAAAGDVLFRIADISRVWVLADVPEYDLGALHLGTPATVRVRSHPDVRFDGKVSVIYPQVSMQTRTTRVRIELANPKGVLLPNMYADVEIATGNDKAVVAVPDSAVIDTGTRQVVIIDRGEGRFEPRAVKVGLRGNGMVEIRDGVAEGDRVVVAANFLIDAESNLKAALNALAAPEVMP